jgi:hypothetical protein
MLVDRSNSPQWADRFVGAGSSKNNAQQQNIQIKTRPYVDIDDRTAFDFISCYWIFDNYYVYQLIRQIIAYILPVNLPRNNLIRSRNSAAFSNSISFAAAFISISSCWIISGILSRETSSIFSITASIC